MKQTKNALAIMKMSAESTSSMMLYYPNGTTLSNGRVKDKSYQVIFLPLLYKLNDYDGLTLSTSTVAGELSKTVDSYGYPSQYKLADKNSFILDLQKFTFDRTTGNLSSRTWTHGESTVFNESFTYDNLDRLTKVSNSNNGSTIMQTSYWDNGNIASKTGIGNYKYDTNKKHAVTEVSNTGKLINSSTVSTEFSLNGKISKIFDDKGCSMSYIYGPDDEKWISTLCDPSLVTTDDIEHIYFGDYEKIIKDNLATEYYFLENNVLFIKKATNSYTSVYKACQAVTDYIGNILAVYNEKCEEVFSAKYDAWGKQTVICNDIDLCYGYTGHEMLPQFGLINMIGRLYDPTLGRFLSCDNYVQAPDDSQSFNRYSYCFNNPLKYTDPDGNIAFGVAMAIFSVASDMMMAAHNGENVLKAGLISAASIAATYGIGSAFSKIKGLGEVGKELLRAGAHGLSSGVFSAIQGNNFGTGFASGFSSSLIGSVTSELPVGWRLASSTLMGGIAAWATGGSFLEGAMNGYQIGFFNHIAHDGVDDNRIETHDRLFRGKNAREKAHKFMLNRSAKTGKEIAAAYLEDGNVIVFHDKYNTEESSWNYWYTEKNGDVYVKINGTTVRVTSEVHTHPKQWYDPTNQCNISIADQNVASMFDNQIYILETSNRGLYRVGTAGNSMSYPTFLGRY